jgi:ADP-dependent NAD(P)H-hydrate dehydratase / NAD(P)H-hydrate epimerase
VLSKAAVPCVIDADALNILSAHRNWQDAIPVGSILTPHRKEFDRLAGEQPNDLARLNRQVELAVVTQSIVVVKGAFTRIALPDGSCFVNSCSAAALATAGSGDVLTGLLTGLVARGYSTDEAALLGVYWHGLAGKLAQHSLGSECVTATDIIDHLAPAYYLLTS